MGNVLGFSIVLQGQLHGRAVKADLADVLWKGVAHTSQSGEIMRAVDECWLLHYIRWKCDSPTYHEILEQ